VAREISRYDRAVRHTHRISCPGWAISSAAEAIVHRSGSCCSSSPHQPSWTHREHDQDFTGREMAEPAGQKHVGHRDRDILLAPDPDWRKESLNLLRENYRKQPYFDQIFPTRRFMPCRTRACGMNLARLDLLEELLDVPRPRLISSEMSPRAQHTCWWIYLSRLARLTIFRLARVLSRRTLCGGWNRTGLAGVHSCISQLHAVRSHAVQHRRAVQLRRDGTRQLLRGTEMNVLAIGAHFDDVELGCGELSRTMSPPATCHGLCLDGLGSPITKAGSALHEIALAEARPH